MRKKIGKLMRSMDVLVGVACLVYAAKSGNTSWYIGGTISILFGVFNVTERLSEGLRQRALGRVTSNKEHKSAKTA